MPGRPDGDLPGTRNVASPVALPDAALPASPVRRVRKAYEQVYDQLRDWIIRGDLSRGVRLPSEAVLAREFGVSRGTVREALRVLAAQNLIRTAKGAGGGSFVTLPTVDHISTFLHANISLLSESDDVTLPEFLGGRELLEVFAARQCAARRTQEDIDRLRATMSTDPAEARHERALHPQQGVPQRGAGRVRQHARSASPRSPVFSVLQTRLRREQMPDSFARRLDDDHRAILEAIEAGDSDAAGEEMQQAHRVPQRHLSGHVARHARQRLTAARRC